MVFYYFGPSPDSWAAGNNKFSISQNLPPALQQTWDTLSEVCQDRSRVGSMISWLSSSPTGDYAIKTQGGEIITNRDDVRSAAQPSHEISHISFSPTGVFLVFYTNDTIKLSSSSPNTFPPAFYSLASRFLDPSTASRQPSFLRSVFFGANNACLIQTDREVLSENIAESLRGRLLNHIGGDLRETGVSLGRATVLCAGEANLHFVEIEKDRGRFSEFIFDVPFEQPVYHMLPAITANERPPDHLINAQQSSYNQGQQPQPPSLQTAQYPAPDPIYSPMNPTTFQLSSRVPEEARTRYELQFYDTADGRSHVTGDEASRLFTTSGLNKADLGKIRQTSDLDSDGRFSLDEFVAAMWKVECLAKGQPLPSASQSGMPPRLNPPNDPAGFQQSGVPFTPQSQPHQPFNPYNAHGSSPSPNPPYGTSQPYGNNQSFSNNNQSYSSGQPYGGNQSFSGSQPFSSSQPYASGGSGPPPNQSYSSDTPVDIPAPVPAANREVARSPTRSQPPVAMTEPTPAHDNEDDDDEAFPRTFAMSQPISCKTCRSGIVPGDLLYQCTSRPPPASPYYYCQSCHDAGTACNNNNKHPASCAELLKSRRGEDIKLRDTRDQTRTPKCKRCKRKIKAGEVSWMCRTCCEDICEDCWRGSGVDVCRHAGLGHVFMWRNEKVSGLVSVSTVVQGALMGGL